MLKFIGAKIGEEIKGKYFDDSRQAFDYIKGLAGSTDNLSNYIVYPVEIEGLPE